MNTTIYVLSRNMKKSEFLSEKFHCLVINFSVYLNRHVFVMTIPGHLQYLYLRLNSILFL